MFFTLIFGDNFSVTKFSKLLGMKVVEKNKRQFLQMVPKWKTDQNWWMLYPDQIHCLPPPPPPYEAKI